MKESPYYWACDGQPCTVPHPLHSGGLVICAKSVIRLSRGTPVTLPPLDQYSVLRIGLYYESDPLCSEVHLLWRTVGKMYPLQIRYSCAVNDPLLKTGLDRYPQFKETLAKRLARHSTSPDVPDGGISQNGVIARDQIDTAFHPYLDQLDAWTLWVEHHRSGLAPCQDIFVDEGKLHVWIQPELVYRPPASRTPESEIEEPRDGYPIFTFDPATVDCILDPEYCVFHTENSVYTKIEILKVSDDLATHFGILDDVHRLQKRKRAKDLLQWLRSCRESNERDLQETTLQAELLEQL